MRILYLQGSPRKNGNSAFFAKVFEEEAKKCGHNIDLLQVGSMNIRPCMACEYCHTKGNGACFQKDDMQQVYDKLEQADMVVFGSAVHYWGFTGQLQSTITRFYNTHKPVNVKKYAMILSSASQNVYTGIINQFNDCMGYFGAEGVGILTFNGNDQKTQENANKVRKLVRNL